MSRETRTNPILSRTHAAQQRGGPRCSTRRAPSIPVTTGAVGCRRRPGFGLTLRPATNEPCTWHGGWMSSAARSLTALSSRHGRRDWGTFHPHSPASSTSPTSIVTSPLSRRQANRRRGPIPSPRDMERWLASLGADEHVAWLSRVTRGDGNVAEIMRRFRQHASILGSATALPLRTAGALRARAKGISERRKKDRSRT